MTWARFDDGAPDHPKVASLTDPAHRLWFNGVCYATRMLTDGHIPANIVPRLYPRRAAQLARELVAAGLWHVAGTGFDIHDYLTYQPTRADVLARRAADSARKRGGFSTESDRPVPSRPTDTSEITTARAREGPGAVSVVRLYEGMGWTINPATGPILEELETQFSDHPEWLTDAFGEAAKARARDVRYVEKTLLHWRDHGRDCECRKPKTERAASGNGRRDEGNTADGERAAAALRNLESKFEFPARVATGDDE
jgi:hypothetical protein